MEMSLSTSISKMRTHGERRQEEGEGRIYRVGEGRADKG